MNDPADNPDSEAFDGRWLQLRANADERARSETLTTAAADWLAVRPSPCRLVDLGAGSGNNAHYLAPRLPGPQCWLLVDHDAELLESARGRLAGLADRAGESIGIATAVRDLSRMTQADLDGADLVCASALFDLASADWIERLAGHCRAVGAAALFTLSVDGHWNFIDDHGRPVASADDAWAARTFNDHQRRDKSLGRALGPDAPAHLIAALENQDYRVVTAPSPWRLEAGTPLARSLGIPLLEARAGALVEQQPDREQPVMDWLDRRRLALAAGTLGMEIGHVDIFAVPTGSAARA